MRHCENNLGNAINNNILGTLNLIKEILYFEKNIKKNLFGPSLV